MNPSDVRRHILDDHRRLRAQLDRIEALSTAPPAQGPDAERDERLRVHALRDEGILLIRALKRHMAWEDRYLVPAIRDSDSWGPERARRLEEEHAEQRDLLNFEMEILLDPARPRDLVVGAFREFIALLRADMDEEERFFLDPDVLRDDVVGIGVAAG